MKTCSNPKCQSENPQPIECFAIDSKSADGRSARCRACRSQWLKEYRANNPEKCKQARDKYNRSEKGRRYVKSRGTSQDYKAYQKKYMSSEAGKRCRKKYYGTPEGRAIMLWHTMNNRCGKKRGYESVTVEMTKEQWMIFAPRAIMAFWAANPDGSPTVHRVGDTGNYSLDNIEIIDKLENTLRSSFLVRVLGVDCDSPYQQRVSLIAKVIKLSLCVHLKVDIADVVGAINGN